MIRSIRGGVMQKRNGMRENGVLRFCISVITKSIFKVQVYFSERFSLCHHQMLHSKNLFIRKNF
ncbi:MAG: hypothetical protein LBS39_00325 [Campylobacteraceae bacterium]|nr:hypothetical protein [Campylobacteraceae bacterium]